MNLLIIATMLVKKRSLIFLLITALLGICITWSIGMLLNLTQSFRAFDQRQIMKPTYYAINQIKATSSEAPLILAWNKAWIKWAKFMDGCSPELNCKVTLDRSRIHESSAVIFHITDRDMLTVPMVRDPRTYFVYFSLEPPKRTPLLPIEHRSSFNLSMTYRLGSDVIFSYGEFLPSTQNGRDSSVDRKILERMVARKSRLVAWFVTNCRAENHRENVVHRMARRIPIDIFGKCGTKQCPARPYGQQKTGSVDANQCHRLLTKTYKFYLSFENSVCRDYVTEKFFSIIDNAWIVPIVLDRQILLDTARDLETARALNRSFIALDDFPSIEALVEYLKYLDANTSAYMEYFEWRETHEINFDRWTKPGCELCRLIMKGEEKVLEDPDAFSLGTNPIGPECSNISLAYMQEI